MRESSDGWGAVPVRSDACWSIGERVYGAIDDCPGTVVGVSDVVAAFVSVVWRGGTDAVVYPQDTIMIRKAWPWES